MVIYVGNLCATAGERHVRELFEAFGEVSYVTIVMDNETDRSGLYGYVLMENEFSAREAIGFWNGRKFMNNYLEVSRASDDAIKK